jgi:transcriptional regulator with XRE-family HTH domain
MDRPVAKFEHVLGGVGGRLRALRTDRGDTLAAVATATGISVSTLSRLEAGRRRPTLELLLPLAHRYRVPLDELVGAPPTGDPRVHQRPVRRNGMTVVPLTTQPGGLRAYKMIIPGGSDPSRPVDQQTHEGYEWFYVLAGRVRLRLGEHDLTLRAGEAAEFDTRVPHWFGSAGREPAEILSLFGPQGERIHTRAGPARRSR